MTNTLYTWVMSTPCASVHLTQAALGIDLKREYVNIWKGEQFSPTFLKINPQHKVPTLVDDNGVVMWDSHVINIYLCSKYGNQSLYPNDLVKRSLVHQMLFYDVSVAFPLTRKLVRKIQKTFVHLIPHATGLNVLIPGVLQHPNVQRWIKNAEKWPFYNENVKCIEAFVKFRDEAINAKAKL
ncbi:hypothetical protein RI129_000137 [Pyrocoelia pectoralis]|uniref:GST N-terminal domain-containing protein n=1 Tax=Pyrocoelia pectoralis TaxID=417401 RepID=A0AAN7Z5I2_9COLE